MYGKRSWSNVKGHLCTDVPVVVPFTSSGYYDPGKFNGLPESCYPPEGDDERKLDGLAYIDFGGRDRKIVLTKEQSEALFGFLYDDVMEVELNEPCDEPEYDA